MAKSDSHLTLRSTAIGTTFGLLAAALAVFIYTLQLLPASATFDGEIWGAYWQYLLFTLPSGLLASMLCHWRVNRSIS